MALQPTGSLATTLIITKGLPCQDLPVDEQICSFGAGITPWFSLYCKIIKEPVIPPEKPAEGPLNVGSIPLMPGEIHHLYRELPQSQQYYIVPRDQEANYFASYNNITLKVKMGGSETEKIFRVKNSQTKHIVTVLSLINVTKNLIVTSIKNVKKISTSGYISIKNIVLRKDKKNK